MGDERLNTLGYPMRAAFDMYDEGIDMLRQRFRRDDPDATDDEIAARVRAWIADRPYDSPGRVR